MKTIIGAALLVAAVAWTARARPAAEPGGGTAKTSVEESTRAKARRELDELGKKIDALEADARREGALVRERLQADVKALRADERDARRELAKLEASGAAARKDLTDRVERAMRKLREAYRKAIGEPKKK